MSLKYLKYFILSKIFYKSEHYKNKYRKIFLEKIQKQVNNTKPKIKDKDVSVVIQGAVNEYTQGCIDSIRKYLPNAVIIISTWENTDTSNLSHYDKVLYNKDPGASGYRSLNKTPDNTDREIVSTLNGLKNVKTRYALKLRAEFHLNGTGFLNYFEIGKNFKRTKDKNTIVSDYRIVTLGRQNSAHYILMFTDFCQFGKTSDLLKLWDIPTTPENEKFYMFENKPYDMEKYTKEGSSRRFFGEMYIMLHFLAKKFPQILTKCKDYTFYTEELEEIGLKACFNNFIYASNIDNIGIVSVRDDLKSINSWGSSFNTFLEDLKYFS